MATIELQDRPVVEYVGVSLSARFSEFGAPGGPNQMIPRIYEWLATNEVVPLGGPLYIYRRFGDATPDPTADLTVAVPVAQPVEPSGGLHGGRFPAGTYVVCRYTGHPDGFSAMQPEVRSCADEHGVRLGVPDGDGDLAWTGYAEHYLTDPNEEPDPNAWVTELLFSTV